MWRNVAPFVALALISAMLFIALTWPACVEGEAASASNPVLDIIVAFVAVAYSFHYYSHISHSRRVDALPRQALPAASVAEVRWARWVHSSCMHPCPPTAMVEVMKSRTRCNDAQPIVVACVVAGADAAYHFTVLLKSILMQTSSPLAFHLVVDTRAKLILQTLLHELPLQNGNRFGYEPEH